MGRKPIAAQSLEYLLSINGIKIIGVLTDNHLMVSPTRDLALSHGLTLYDYDQALAAIKAGNLKFDIGLSVLYWRILSDEFLTLPSRGIINFHPAPLPEYKGTAGYNIAILDELTEWAVTAHYIDEGIDTGGIIEVSRFKISKENETAKSLEYKSQSVLFDLFTRTVNSALNSQILLKTSPNIGGRYVSRKEMELMKEVLPGDNVSRKIRAFWFPPYDGANIIVNGVRCTLVDSFILQQLADPTISSLFTKKTL